MRDSEMFIPRLKKFLAAHGDEYEDENKAVQAFTGKYNEMINDPSLFETALTDKDKAYQELEKLDYAEDEKEIKRILNKALRLAHDNLDACFF